MFGSLRLLGTALRSGGPRAPQGVVRPTPLCQAGVGTASERPRDSPALRRSLMPGKSLNLFFLMWGWAPACVSDREAPRLTPGRFHEEPWRAREHSPGAGHFRLQLASGCRKEKMGLDMSPEGHCDRWRGVGSRGAVLGGGSAPRPGWELRLRYRPVVALPRSCAVHCERGREAITLWR